MAQQPDPSNWYGAEIATLGDRLSGAREHSGLSKPELAEKIGVKTETLRAWENDVKEPRANRLQMLSGMLGVSLSWLLTGDGHGPAGPANTAAVPDSVTDLIDDIRQLKVQMQKSTDTLDQLERRLKAAVKDMM